MQLRKYSFTGTRGLKRAVRDFVEAWIELEALLQLMDRNGLSKEDRDSVLEDALRLVVKDSPDDGREEAARRVRELLEYSAS